MYVWWKVCGPIPKTTKKERGKLIRDTLKRNTGKLIEDGGSISKRLTIINPFFEHNNLVNSHINSNNKSKFKQKIHHYM